MLLLGTSLHKSNSTLSLVTADLLKLDQCNNLLCMLWGQQVYSVNHKLTNALQPFCLALRYIFASLDLYRLISPVIFFFIYPFSSDYQTKDMNC